MLRGVNTMVSNRGDDKGCLCMVLNSGGGRGLGVETWGRWIVDFYKLVRNSYFIRVPIRGDS